MRKRVFIVLFAAVFAACSDSTTAPGTGTGSDANTLVWRDVASTASEELPANRDFYAAASIGDRIYAIEYDGGLYAFDPALGAWARKAPLPDFRMEAGVTVANGKLYVLGGQLGEGVGTTRVEAYDPTQDAWTRWADLPQAVCKPGVATVGGKIYVIGGDAPGGPSKLVQRYDIGSDRWTLGTEMPTRRCALGLGVSNGKIVAIGGIGGGFGDWWHIVRSVQEYDPVTDTWTDKSPLPDARDRIAVVSLRDRLFVLGGRTTSQENAASRAVFEYDPSGGTWSEQTSLNHERYYHASATLNGAIYVLGGRIDSSTIEPVVERGEFR